jgi:hypothetical protein
MFARPHLRTLIPVGALGAVCGLLAGCGQSATGTAPVAAQQTQASPSAQASQHAAGRFTKPLTVDNPMFPLVPGTEFTYSGTIVEGGETKPHTVVFTVADLTKMVDGVRTVVAWDRDFRKGTLQEQELAFFAQDDQGNVWNFGEYPEEYDNGQFTGAPSTWIRGVAGAYGGMHMLSRPRMGLHYQEGLVPAIEFDDVSLITGTGQTTCMSAHCYRQVLVVDETSPNDPTSGHQIKYYAPRTGLVRVSARGGDTQEFLTLTAVRHLGQAEMAKVRAAALAMDQRAYRVAKVYRATKPAEQNQG